MSVKRYSLEEALALVGKRNCSIVALAEPRPARKRKLSAEAVRMETICKYGLRPMQGGLMISK